MKFAPAVIFLSVLCLLCLSGMGLSDRGLSDRGLSAVAAEAAADSDLDQFTPVNPPLPAPDITVTARTGQSLALSDLRGRPVLLNFWATWCAPCVAEMPSLDRLAAGRAQTPLAIMAVAEDRGGEAAAGPFIEQHNLTSLPVFLDPKGSALKAFGLDALPVTILIDRQGREVAQFLGPVDWDSAEARRAVDRLLKSSPPDRSAAWR